MNRIVKDTLKIFLITAVAGILLGAVYVITKEPIKNAEIAAEQAAYKEVFLNGKEFVEMDTDLTDVNDALKNEGFEDETIDKIINVTDENGSSLGYVFTVTTSAGYGGDISFSVGIKEDGTVNGYSILSISETAGLGMKATEEKFKSQFEDKAVEEFRVTKSGAASQEEVDAISGATITSKAVTGGVNACIFYMNQLMEGGVAHE